MSDLQDSRIFRTQRQRWALVVVASLLFAYGIGVSEPQPLNPAHALAVTLAAVVAIACWAIPGSWNHLLRLVGLGLAGVAVQALDHRGPGEAAVFAAIAMGEIRLPERVAIPLTLGLLGILELLLVLQGASGTELLVTAAGIGLLWLAMASSRRTRLAGDRTREVELDRAIVEERARLAREIHDVLAHSLTALVVQLDSAAMLAEKKPAELPEALGSARRLAREGLAEARRAVGALRGDELPGPDLLPALVSDFQATSAIPAELAVEGVPLPLSSEAQLAIYRTAQEALTNVRKHARPERVEVRLAYRDDGAELLVEDTGGQSTGPLSASGGGYGLAGMRERAELAGGTLEAGPTPAGFRVRLRLPA